MWSPAQHFDFVPLGNTGFAIFECSVWRHTDISNASVSANWTIVSMKSNELMTSANWRTLRDLVYDWFTGQMRKLQRHAEGRMPKPRMVRLAPWSPRRDRKLAKILQHRTPAFVTRIFDAGPVQRKSRLFLWTQTENFNKNSCVPNWVTNALAWGVCSGKWDYFKNSSQANLIFSPYFLNMTLHRSFPA